MLIILDPYEISILRFHNFFEIVAHGFRSSALNFSGPEVVKVCKMLEEIKQVLVAWKMIR